MWLSRPLECRTSARREQGVNMLASISRFFEQFIEPGTRAGDGDDPRALQVATAALLLEMMRMDDRVSDEERAAISDSLRRQFGLTPAQLDALMALAEQQARDATDYYQFTSLINRSCDAAQKVQIIENLWRVAFADGQLDAHEMHLMRKLADLLYVRHGDYAAAKQRVRAASTGAVGN